MVKGLCLHDQNSQIDFRKKSANKNEYCYAYFN